MPEICRFYGMVITINWREHNPPHFHVRYAEYTGVFGILHIEQTEGQIPRRARSMVLEWAALHQQELLENWLRAQEKQPLNPIEPLS